MPPMEGDATGTVSVASAVSDEPRATVLKEAVSRGGGPGSDGGCAPSREADAKDGGLGARGEGGAELGEIVEEEERGEARSGGRGEAEREAGAVAGTGAAGGEGAQAGPLDKLGRNGGQTARWGARPRGGLGRVGGGAARGGAMPQRDFEGGAGVDHRGPRRGRMDAAGLTIGAETGADSSH